MHAQSAHHRLAFYAISTCLLVMPLHYCSNACDCTASPRCSAFFLDAVGSPGECGPGVTGALDLYLRNPFYCGTTDKIKAVVVTCIKSMCLTCSTLNKSIS